MSRFKSSCQIRRIRMFLSQISLMNIALARVITVGRETSSCRKCSCKYVAINVNRISSRQEIPVILSYISSSRSVAVLIKDCSRLEAAFALMRGINKMLRNKFTWFVEHHPNDQRHEALQTEFGCLHESATPKVSILKTFSVVRDIDACNHISKSHKLEIHHSFSKL